MSARDGNVRPPRREAGPFLSNVLTGTESRHPVRLRC